jgi:hypothetical protein
MRPAEFEPMGPDVDDALRPPLRSPAPRCPSCGLVMSDREAVEQGACNECHPGGAYDPSGAAA